MATPPGSVPSGAADTIDGLGGGDILVGGGGGDTINGGGGDDRVDSKGSGNVLHGNGGDDGIGVGLPGAPAVGGNDVTNRLYGDDGDDKLTATYGPGCYDFECPSGGSGNRGTLFFYGGPGNDRLAVDAPDYWAADVNAGVVPTYMYGGAGDDFIQGTRIDCCSDGTHSGSTGVLAGGPGNDTYLLCGSEQAIEKAGEGYDTLTVEDATAYVLPAGSHVEEVTFTGLPVINQGVEGRGNELNNIMFGSSFDDSLHGLGGADVLYGGSDSSTSGDILHGGAGNDVIYGGQSSDDLEDGPDTIYGDVGDDTVWAGGGGDVVHGGAGNDSLYGQSDDDQLYGGDGADVLGGGSGNDRLDGGLGDDRLTGREGLDRLYGGGGGDRFDYDDVAYSSAGAANRDVIYDFTGAGTAASDLIDLSTIDADTGVSGNQTFDFIGNAAFSSPGQLRVQGAGTDSLVQANVTGTAGAEMEILAMEVAYGQWEASDFVL